MKQFLLFGSKLNPQSYSMVILFMRLFIGAAMLTHGITKLIHYDTIVTQFANPLHIGHNLSLILATGAEIVGSILIILGLLTRLASIVLIFNMSVIVFFVLQHFPFAGKELAFMYWGWYVVLFFIGPGNYSLDHILFNKNKGSDQEKIVCNLSHTDRIVRIVIGCLLFVLYFVPVTTNEWALLLPILGTIIICTGIAGYCGIYTLMNISTKCKK